MNRLIYKLPKRMVLTMNTVFLSAISALSINIGLFNINSVISTNKYFFNKGVSGFSYRC